MPWTMVLVCILRVSCEICCSCVFIGFDFQALQFYGRSHLVCEVFFKVNNGHWKCKAFNLDFMK